MTKSVTYNTARGTEIKVMIVTERGKVADASRKEACWSLEFEVNGKNVDGKRVDHPEVGPSIELDMGLSWEGKKPISNTATAPIPAAKLAEVDALLNEYKAGVKANNEAFRQAADEQAAHDDRRAFIARQ